MEGSTSVRTGSRTRVRSRPRYAKPTPPWWRSVLGWLLKDPVRLLAAAGALLLIMTAPFGGWRTAEPEQARVLQVGEQGTFAPFELTVHSAGVTRSQPGFVLSPLRLREKGAPGDGLYVVVLATVRTTSDLTVTGVTAPTITDLLWPADLPRPVENGAPADPDRPLSAVVYNRADFSQLSGVGPGLTYEVAFVYATASPVAELPETLTFTVQQHTYRADTFDRSTTAWLSPETVAEIELPLGPVPPDAFGSPNSEGTP